MLKLYGMSFKKGDSMSQSKIYGVKHVLGGGVVIEVVGVKPTPPPLHITAFMPCCGVPFELSGEKAQGQAQSQTLRCECGVSWGFNIQPSAKAGARLRFTEVSDARYQVLP